MLEQIIKKLATKETTKLTAQKPDEDFLPYVCNYDKETILTKNGELLKIIRVTGLSNKNSASDLFSLRESIRDAIYKNIKDEGFAFWFHTIRRKKSVADKSKDKIEEFFAKEINKKWIEYNDFENQFVNEIYISVIIEGVQKQPVNIQNILQNFSYNKTKNIHQQSLEKSSKKLNNIVDKIFVEIEDYGAKILGIEDYEGVLYSPHLRFFGKIINLEEQRFPVAINDMSNELINHKIAFGNREIEVATENNKNFAAIFSIKEYHEVSIDSLDVILNLPFEFIISQSFDFFYDKKELEKYQHFDEILQISQDDFFREVSGYKNFTQVDANHKNNYGKLQTTLMLISKNKENLENEIALAIEKFSSLGFILVREDIFLEHCFWAQLPANFSFLRRQKIINTLNIAGFTSISSFPSGLINSNHWGPCVTTFKTIINTPYFFSFHENNLGHSLIFGPKKSGKTILTNFLLSEARRFGNKIYYFDYDNSSKCFIKALSGQYYKLTKNIEDEEFLEINPLLLSPNEENAGFLTNFIEQLLMFLKIKISEEELIETFEIIKNVLKNDNKNFITLHEALKTEKTKVIYEKLKIWANGKLSYIFGSKNEIDWNSQIIGFDLQEIINQKPILIPVFSYLLYKIETILDGSPTIIIIDECFEFVDNKFFENILSDWLKVMKEKNCTIIFNSQDHLYISESKIAKQIVENIATEIYLPNGNPQEYLKDIFNLSNDELDVLKHMDNSKSRHCLIKNSGNSLIVENDFSLFEEYLSILSSDNVAVATMEEILANKIIESKGEFVKPENWIADFVEILKEIKKENIAPDSKEKPEEDEEEKDDDFDVKNIKEDDELDNF